MPEYSIQMCPESLDDYTFPSGKASALLILPTAYAIWKGDGLEPAAPLSNHPPNANGLWRPPPLGSGRGSLDHQHGVDPQGRHHNAELPVRDRVGQLDIRRGVDPTNPIAAKPRHVNLYHHPAQHQAVVFE
jgi:hypothetical protein